MSKKSNKKLHIICLCGISRCCCAQPIWLLGRVCQPKYMSGVSRGRDDAGVLR